MGSQGFNLGSIIVQDSAYELNASGYHQSENLKVWIRIEDTKFKKIKIA
jgi:hypothetical protein